MGRLTSLSLHSPLASHLWVVLDDFNQILRTSKNSEFQVHDVDTSSIEDFNIALHDASLFEVQSKGLPFSWWNHRVANHVEKNIDHILVNKF